MKFRGQGPVFNMGVLSVTCYIPRKNHTMNSPVQLLNPIEDQVMHVRQKEAMHHSFIILILLNATESDQHQSACLVQGPGLTQCTIKHNANAA